MSLTAMHTDAEVEELLEGFSELMSYWQQYRSLLGPNLGFVKEFISRQAHRPLKKAARDPSPRRGLLP